MSSYQSLKINGVVSTDKTVLENLNDLSTAAGAFLTYDISQGKWAVVINRVGTSVKSYTNANIIGSINVTETGVSELYNSASFEFPNRSLRDQTDFVDITIDDSLKFNNEVDNRLNIQSSLINDPIQAQYIASVELKQSRLNKIITFNTDYTSLGIKAGDLIDVTTDIYGYTNKMFRVISVEESDDEVIGISITALEYDADVYSTSGLSMTERTKKTGIMLKQQNSAVQASEDANVAGSIGRMIAANVGLGIANKLLNKLFGRKQIGTDANGNPIYDKQTKPADQSGEDIDKVLAGSKRPKCTVIAANKTNICGGQTVRITISHTCSSCLFDIPDFDYEYEITGVPIGDIDVPVTGTVTVSGGSGYIDITADSAIEDGTLTFVCDGLTKTVGVRALTDYTYSVAKDNASITEGGTVVVTLTATGSKADATIPYAITGTASGKVSSPALTGTVTTSGGTATLTIVTTDDSSYTGTQSLTITFDGATTDYCGTVGTKSTTVSVLDNDTAPPASKSCSYITVPVVWCGSYDGATDELQSVTARKSASFAVAQAGEPTIQLPLTLTVTKGNPSTIAVATYATVAQPIADMGGSQYKVITTFNSVVPLGLITGTTTTVTGYD